MVKRGEHGHRSRNAFLKARQEAIDGVLLPGMGAKGKEMEEYFQ